MHTRKVNRNRCIIGILGGISFGYIFALDITGWYFLKPTSLLLFEIISALFIFRITHGLMQDERISPVFKRGYIWAMIGMILAYLCCLGYTYTNEQSANFSIDHIDFAESLVMSWIYLHMTVLGFIFGAFAETIINRRKVPH